MESAPKGWEDDASIYLDQETGKFMKLDFESNETFEWVKGEWKKVSTTALKKGDKTDTTTSNKKRKRPSEATNSANQSHAASNNRRKNTSVFVSGLPSDVTVPEVSAYFQKCGIILEEIDNSKKAAVGADDLSSSMKQKIKLYRKKNDDGSFVEPEILNGEALVVYYKEESVPLACNLLDETEFRPGYIIKVQPAVFNKEEGQNRNTQGSTSDSRKKKLTKEEQRLIKKRMELMEKKLDWFEPGQTNNSEDDLKRLEKLRKIVIVKGLFKAKQETEEKEANKSATFSYLDAATYAEIKEDLQEECEKLGDVTKIQIYDQSKEGAASIKFREELAASACVQLMNGRYFDGEKLVAYQCVDALELGALKKLQSRIDDDEENKRLEEFGDWISQI